MDEFNMMNLDELLNVVSDDTNTVSGKMFTSADVEVEINKGDTNEEVKEETQVLVNDSIPNAETPENQETETDQDRDLTKAEFAEINRKEAMNKLAEYEAYENKLAKLDGELSLLNTQLESLVAKIKLDNKELIDKINSISNEIDSTKDLQDKVKEELLPLQREVYLVNNDDKTLKYNKIQSTYVARTEKNQFDLKKFREEQDEFWRNNLDIMKPYAKITEVSDYLKITISKK